MSISNPQNLISPDNEPLKKKHQVVIAGVNFEQQARDVAEQRLLSSKEELKGIKGFWKKIWNHNLAYEYYRQKEIFAVRREIEETQNLYQGEEGTQEDHARAMEAIVQRFTNEFDENLRRSGEMEKVLDENSPEENEIKEKIKQLIIYYAGDKISEEDFNLEKENLFKSEIRGVKDENNKNIIDENSLYADNLLEMAKQVKNSIAHGASLDKLDEDLEIKIGKARTGVDTEIESSLVDRAIKRITRSRVGSVLASEEVLSLGTAIAYSVFIKAGVSTVSRVARFAGGIASGAVVGGLVTGARENKRLKEERAQHGREMAKGGQIEKDSARREEMEKYRHETRNAKELTGNLQGALAELKNAPDENKLQVVLENLNEISARIAFSDRKKIDLVSFSDAKNVEQERTEMSIAIAQAKVFLKNNIKAEWSKLYNDEKEMKEYLAKNVEEKNEKVFLKEMSVKDEAFRKMKKSKVINAVIKGGVIGLGIGVVVQEASAALGYREGIFSSDSKHVAGQPHNVTALKSIQQYFSGEKPSLDVPRMHDVSLGQGASVKLPEGIGMAKNPDGTFNLFQEGTHEVISGSISFNPDGTLSEASKNILHTQGIFSDSITTHIEGGKIDGGKNFIDSHESLFNKITRTNWAENDTPRPDKNELRLLWGGTKGTGIDAKGNFVFNVKHMTQGGSFHGAKHWDAQSLMKAGKMKMLLSLSEGTQNQVVEVPIDANGNAMIDPNSEIGKIAFKMVDGHAKFLGKFAEVAVADSNSGAGHVNILATHIGDGIKDVPVVVDHHATLLNMPSKLLENNVEIPFPIPASWRNPLEKLSKEDKNTADNLGFEGSGYFNSYFNGSSVESNNFIERRSESLDNPNAELEHYSEIEKYFDRLPKERYEEIKKLSAQITQPMHPDCKTVVCIPAAGHQEEKNIYKTLSLYKNQKKINGKEFDVNSFEVVVFVNHPKDKSPDDTANEVRRFISDNPEMNVRLMYKQLEKSEAKIGNVRKYLSDVALLRHHLRGKEAEDLILISNDADCEGMSDTYIDAYLNKFNSNKRIDAIMGKLDWEKETFVKSPLIHVGTRLFQYLDAVYRHPKKDSPYAKAICSSGANFGLKSSMYAAVGGYREHDSLGEDRNLGNMIKFSRKGASHYPIEYGGAHTEIITNSRRAVDAFKKGLSPVEQWSSGFGPNDALRNSKWSLEGLEDIKSVEYQEFFREKFQSYVNSTIREYEVSPESKVVEKALSFLHVKDYKIEKNKIVFNDVKQLSELINYLKDYNNNHYQNLEIEQTVESKKPNDLLMEFDKKFSKVDGWNLLNETMKESAFEFFTSNSKAFSESIEVLENECNFKFVEDIKNNEYDIVVEFTAGKIEERFRLSEDDFISEEVMVDLESFIQKIKSIKETLAATPTFIKQTEEHEHPLRAAAWHTVSGVKSFDELNGGTPEEREEAFIKATIDVWKNFTVHGMLDKPDSITKADILKHESDLDGRACLKLLELSKLKFDPTTIVKYVKQGDINPEGIIMDTGNTDGIVAEEEGKRLILDHHGDKSDRTTSATKHVYETLVGLGLLKKEEYLDRYVDFVTKCDNNNFTEAEHKMIYSNFSKNMYTLKDRLKTDDILELLKNGTYPAKKLPDEFLKKHKYADKKGEKSLFDYSNLIEKNIKGLKTKAGKEVYKPVREIIDSLGKEGFVLDTGKNRFGKILIDTNKQNDKGEWWSKVPNIAGLNKAAVRAAGYQGYLIWSEPEDNFVLYTDNVMDEKSIPGGFPDKENVKNIRGGMLKKVEGDGGPLKMTLEQLLGKLSGKADFKIDGKLKEAIDNEEKLRGPAVKKYKEEQVRFKEEKEKIKAALMVNP